MGKILLYKRFDSESNAENAKRSQQWLTTFENFLETIEPEDLNKLKVLINQPNFINL